MGYAGGLNSYSVESFVGPSSRASGSPVEKSELIPVHHAFLSRRIPAYEQLFNVDMLLNKKNMYFVGQPLNIRDVREILDAVGL